MGISFSYFRRLGLTILFPVLGLSFLTLIYLNGKRIKNPFLDSDFENSSYLSDTTYFGTAGFSNQYLLIFGSEDLATRAAFESMSQDYELKSHYGLLNINGERAFNQQFLKFSETAFDNYQKSRAHLAAKGATSKLSAFSDLKTPAAIMAFMAAMYTGRMVEYRASNDLRIRSQSLISDNRVNHQYLGVDTHLLTGSVDYLGQGSAGQSSSDDYKAGFSGKSESLGAQAGAAYTMKSQTVTMTLSKKITENVNVSYDRVEPASSKTEHTVGVGFTSGF